MKKKVKSSLKYSIIDGAFYSFMVGMGESFLSAFAIFLNATVFQIGLISALPQSLGSFFELLSDRLLRKFKSRKMLVTLGSLLQGLMYIPVLLTFLFGEAKVAFLIIFVCLYWIFGMIISPIWNSWMGDLVDEKHRGKYFGKRNRITGMASFVSFVLGGLILQKFTGDNFQYLGYIIIFSIALISRIISVIFLLKQFDPEYQVPQVRFRFRQFFSELTKSDFGIFTLYLSFMSFSVNFAAPFFTPYMLSDLRLTYMTFTIITATAIITKFCFMPIWGIFADKFGAVKILQIAGTFMPFVSVLWLFSHNFWYLIAIQVFSGFFWAAFEISSLKFMFDTTHHEKRAALIGYYNFLNGIGLIMGAMLGSYTATHNKLFFSKYLLVFLISFLLRFSTSAIFLPKLKEIKKVPRIGHQKLLFRVLTTMPNRGLVYRIIPIARRKHKSKS